MRSCTILMSDADTLNEMPDTILQEIRDNYDYAQAYWAENRREGEKDITYLVKGPWEEDELGDRGDRITLTLDELGQYVNQICNEFRMTKRAVKVNPRGDGANDQTALMRADMIREIEYQSRAQHAYVSAGEDAVRRWVGYFKLKVDYEPGTFNRVLQVVRMPNPDVVLLDPDFKKTDASDCAWAFEIESYREKDFIKRFGKDATITDFEGLGGSTPGIDWITSGTHGRHVRVASYWKIDKKPKPIYLLENGQTVNPAEDPTIQIGKDVAIVQGQPVRIVEERDDEADVKLKQYISNGLEILKEKESVFKEIPIIPVFGREIWVTTNGVAKRVYESAIRKARGAFKAYCYVGSALVERLAMDPKTPYEGFEGQFDTQSFKPGNDPDKTLQKFVEFKPLTTATGEAILGMPRRTFNEPQIGQYLSAADFYRRGVQAGMGSSPLPTDAQRVNQKSGVALSKIEHATDQGNFNFVDSYDIAIERAGRMMDAVLDVVYDTPREQGFRDEAGNYSVKKINQVDPVTGAKTGFHTSDGDHGVTISTGPSDDSQRDAADDFIEQLIQNPAVLGPHAQQILALLVKLKNLGPIGDMISKILDPQQSNDPAAQAQIAAAQKIIQQLQAELQQAKSGDAIKKYTVDEQEKTKRVLGLIKVDQQDAETRLDAMLGTITDHFDRHAQAMEGMLQRQHEQQMAQQQQEAAAQQAQQQPQAEGATA